MDASRLVWGYAQGCERHGVAKSQVSGLCRGRVRGKYLHHLCAMGDSEYPRGGKAPMVSAGSEGRSADKATPCKCCVYAGVDPLTGNRLYPSESTTDQAEASGSWPASRHKLTSSATPRPKLASGLSVDTWPAELHTAG
jgi:hypothetical protein